MSKFDRLIRRVRTALIPQSLARYRGEAWYTAIRSCQDEIASSKPNPKYLAGYMQDELYYWLHISRWLYKRRSEPGQARCLDIGCAYGTLALFCERVLGAEVSCTDIRTDYISEVILDRHGFNFALSNIELDPLPWNTTYDIILFTEVLEHLNFHPVATLRKIGGHLGPHGRLYLSTPDAREWGRAESRYQAYEEMPKPDASRHLHDGHIYIYDEQELLEIADHAGLDVQRLDYAPGIAGRHINLELTVKQAIKGGGVADATAKARVG